LIKRLANQVDDYRIRCAHQRYNLTEEQLRAFAEEFHSRTPRLRRTEQPAIKEPGKHGGVIQLRGHPRKGLRDLPTARLPTSRVRGGGLIYEEPKTRRSQRTLALPMPLVAALHQHNAVQLGEQMLAGSEWHDEDLVFAQANGRPIDKKTDYDWTRLLKAAGVRHVRLHDGRHTADTLLLTENLHPRVVMELLGHSQMRTTMDIYSHVMPALAREAADRMGALLLPGKGRSTATTGLVDCGQDEESPAQRGGAEGTRTPNPTLPGRLVGVHRRPLPFISAGRATVRSTMNSLEQA
jgi:integrase